MKKHLVLIAICYCFIFPFPGLKAQSWINMMKDQKTNVHDVQKAFNQWYATHKNTNPNSREEIDGPYEQFKRWEWLMEPRTYPSGNRPVPGAIAQQYAHYLENSSNTHTAKHVSLGTANWKYAGNDSVPAFGGDGRVNYLRFMPGNDSIIFACGPTGGLWETTNAGQTWFTKTDNLVDMSVSDIAIDPTNTSIMYISTGDGDGIYGGYTTLSTVGVLKSTDGGNTWNATGLSYTQSVTGPAFSTVNQLLLDSNNTSYILAATSFGLYRTTNAGTTWTQVDTGDFRSIEFEPFHSSVVYASTFNGQYYRSTDTGNTWTYITNGLPAPRASNRIKIAVTPADSNYVYLVIGQTGTYLSTDRGQTFNQTSGSDQIGYQYWYTMSLCVSPTNADSVFEGGLDNYVSADSGVSWNQVSSWGGLGGYPYVHADVHCIVPVPGSGSTYYEANDGGVFQCSASTDSWTDMSHNLAIGALYNIGPSADDSGMWLSGWQDNGVNLSSPFWQEIYGGDGMISFIDYSNDQNWYVENYDGDFQMSPNGGITWNTISSGLPNGPWVTKWLQNRQNPNSLYGGFQDVWYSPDQGTSWTQITTWGSATNNFISALCIDPVDSNVLYAAQPGLIEVTNNGGNSWQNITGNLPVNNAGISGIALDPANPARVWVCFSGYSAPDKIYQSTNMGRTWTDISNGLPNLPVNCILFQDGSPNESVYIGMDAGVYYRDTILNSWIPYDAGLPNVIVNDLEMFYPNNTLLAATYGRGVWSSPAYVESDFTGVNGVTYNKQNWVAYPNPTNGNINIDATLATSGEYTLSVYNMLGQIVYTNKINASKHYTSTLNLASYGKGIYLLVLNGQNQTLEKKIVVN